MNLTEFVKIASLDKFSLWKKCLGLTKRFGSLASLHLLMDLRRDLQKNLSVYSKGKQQVDPLQMNAVYVIELLSKWCGRYYKSWAMKEILNRNPNLVKSPQKLKGLTSQAWEMFVRQKSY